MERFAFLLWLPLQVQMPGNVIDAAPSSLVYQMFSFRLHIEINIRMSLIVIQQAVICWRQAF